MLEISRGKIKCPIFSAREKIIQKLNHDLWRGDFTSSEITGKARQLFSEAALLSSCPKYSRGRLECKTCQAIADLRKKRVSYIIGPDAEICRNPPCEPAKVLQDRT